MKSAVLWVLAAIVQTHPRDISMRAKHAGPGLHHRFAHEVYREACALAVNIVWIDTRRCCLPVDERLSDRQSLSS